MKSIKKKIVLFVIFIAELVVAAGFAEALEKKPVYFLFAMVPEQARELGTLLESHGVDINHAGYFTIDGRTIKRLERDAPEQVVYLRNLEVPFLYHGEEMRSTPGISELIRGKTWEEAVELVIERYSHKMDSFGSIDVTRPGGLPYLESVLGRPAHFFASHSIFGAPSQYAYRRLSPYAECELGRGEFHGLQGYPDEIRKQFMYLGNKSEFFWYMGSLYINPHHYVGFRNEQSLENLKRELNRVDRTRKTMVMIVATGADVQEVYEPPIRYIAEEFIPDNPGSRFVSTKDLIEMMMPEHGKILSMETLNRAVDVLLENWEGRPPNHVKLPDEALSLTDMFQALTGALNSYNSRSRLPESVLTTELYGPIGQKEMLSRTTEPRQPFSDRGILMTASQIHRDMREYPRVEYSPVPLNRVPYLISAGNRGFINAAEFLLLMAKEFMIVYNTGKPGDVSWEKADILPPSGDLWEKMSSRSEETYPLWYSQLQLWTVKSQRWKEKISKK